MTPEHERMQKWAGAWTGEALTFIDPEKGPEKATWRGQLELLFGGRFAEFVYAGEVMGKAHQGRLLIAFEKDEANWRMCWLDTFHTGTTLLVSNGPKTDGEISVKGDYFVTGHPRWGWRTAIDDSRDGELLLRMFNNAPGGDEELAIELLLKKR